MELPSRPPKVRVVVCDLADITACDADTVDALARLALDARRLGCVLRIEHPSAELRELIAFMGLDEVLR